MPNSPSDILLDKTNILEIAANGTVVGNLSTTDPDVGDTFTYELLDDAGGRFALSNGNQIVVANNSLLNYQNAIFHTIKVRTTDSTGLSYEKNINIGLIDAKRNLIGYWKLDENTVSSFDNASFVNNNNDGTTQGSLNIGREGLLNGSVGFGNGQINVGKNLLSYSASAASFTVAAWIKPTNFNDNQSIFGVDNTDGKSTGWNLGLSENRLYLYIPQINRDYGRLDPNATLIRADIPRDLLPNQWFHVALTYQGNTRTIYINGVQIASENWVSQDVLLGIGGVLTIPTPLPASDSNRNYLIGAETSDGAARFKGDIDEVRLYNKPLSQAEILGVMEETNLAPKNLKLSNSSLLASSLTDGTIIGDFSVQDSLLDVNKHIYSLIDDAGGLVAISNNRLILNNARLLDYGNNPNPTIKVRATDPDKNIVEQEFKLQLIPEEGDPLNKSLVLYYKLDEASNNNYRQAVINSAGNKPTNAGLFAQYFEDRELTKNILTRIDPNINFFWNHVGPQRGLVSDFGTRWTGQITAPTTGEYTFYLRADDGARLWINGQQLINAWNSGDFNRELTATISLEAGRAYDFRMEYYDGGGAGRTTLSWSGAGIGKQLVPASAFSIPASIQNAGLLGEYFNDRNLTNKALTRTDLGVNFAWEDWMSPDLGIINKDLFGARWTGQLIAPVTGEYTFYIKVDDGVRLWVNGQQLINAWRLSASQEYSGKITLEAGKFYDFKLEYYDEYGYGKVQVAWEALGLTKQIIPGNAFTNQKLGLAGEYFSDINLGTKILERSDANVNFDWGGGTPDPNLNWKEVTDDPNQVGTDDFSARWTGKFKAPVSGEYTFWLNTKSDDGVRLWVNNQPLVNAWERGDGIDEYSAKITLEQGKDYDFKLEYYNPDADAGVQVSWEAPGLEKQIIPSQVFFQQTQTYSNQASGYYTGTVNPVTKLISQGPNRGQDGIYGNSAKFSQGNYIDLKINDQDLQYDKQFTLMAWVKPENFNGLQEIFAPNTYTIGLGFGLDSKGIRLQSFVGNDPSTWIALPNSTLANQWMHLAVSHDNGTVKFYLNSTEIGTRNLDANYYPDWANDSYTNSDYSYLIGGINKDRISNEGLNEGLKGNIDEFRFYNQVLTGSQITGIIEKYNSGPSDITIASNVITADTANGTAIGQLDTVGIPLDKGKYSYQLLDDAGGKFALNGDQIVVKDKSLLSYLDRATETIKIKSTNQRNQSVEKEITIQLIQSEPETGLKAYYKLDETSNLTLKQAAIDSSGNNKHGVYNAGVVQDTQTAGAVRGELGIDGTSVSFSNWQDYINIGNQSITYSDQFTVSTWIRPTQLSGWQMILSANDSDNGAGFGFGLWDKRLVIVDWQSDRRFTADLPAAITPDQWIQVGATYVGQTVTLYLNGLAVGSQSFPITSTNRNYLIGAGRTNANDPNGYNGQIDEVRFYDRALSADELKKLGNQPPSALELDNTSLIEFNQRYPNTFESAIATLSTTDANTEAHTYELIENPNGIFKIENNQLMVAKPELVDYETAQSYDVVIRTTDAAGNSLDKKFTINIIDTPDINKVAVFDGVNDYIGVNSASPILEGNQFTLEAWVFSQATDGDRGIINFGENQGPRISVVNQTNLVYGFGNSVKTATGVLAANEWHQIAVSFNGQTLKLYVDGQLKDSTDDFAGQTPGAGQQLTIGKGEQFFQGKLDDIRIWKVSRTEQEIQYNQYQTLSGTEPHLVAFYSFDEKDATQTNGVVDSTGSDNIGTLLNGTLVQIDSLPPDPTEPSAAQELTTMELPLLGKLPLDFVPDFLPKFEDILSDLFENSDLNFSDGYSFAEYVKNLLPEGATIERVVQTPGTPEQDEYKISYSEIKTLTSVALSGNLGLPGFGIKTNGSANVDLVGQLNFTVGYNDIWGAYIDGGEGPRYSPDGDLINPYGATAVTINLSPRLSEDFSATGNLGFFQLDLKNDPNNPTGLNALYRLGLEDPNILRPGETETGDENDSDGDGDRIRLSEYRLSKGRKEILDSRFQFEPHIGLDAKTSFNGSAVLPSFNFKLGVNWEPTIYTGGELTTGSLLPKSVAFNQVNLGLGTFVSDVIRPIVTQVNTVITPFRPIIKFATDDIPVFEQLGLKSFFDYNQDNRVTVLDLTNIFKVKILGQDPIDDRFFKVLNAINKVSLNLEQMANTPADQELAVNLGSYVFDDINTKISNPFKNKKPEKTEEAESQDDGLNKGTNSSYLSKAKNLFNSIKDVEGLGFPILTDPFQAMYLLTGQDNADLITFDLPELEFTFDVAREFSIWGPLFGRLGGGFSATANLGFGYDTYGLTKWKNNNFSPDTAFLDTLDGFYVNTPPAPFNQLQLRAYVEAGFGIDVVVAAGYLIGGIEGKAGLRLVDKPDTEGSVDDKLRPSEIASRPFIDNFNLNGSVSFYLDAYARLGLSAAPLFEWRRNLLTAKLFEFSVGGGASGFTSNKYISGATVFLDSNFNLLPDDGEPNTISGLDASYQLNYSLATYDKNNNGVIDPKEGQLVSVGGTDIYTQLPVHIVLTAPGRYEMITPVTTLVNVLELNGFTSQEAEANVLFGLGLNPTINLATFNAQKEIENGNEAGKAVMAAHVKLHNVMEQITQTLKGVSTFSTGAISQVVSKNIADELVSELYKGKTLELMDEAVIKRILDNSVTALVELEALETQLRFGPTAIALSNQTVEESSANNLVVGILSTTDPEANDTFAYTLVTDADGRFAINGNKITVANGSLLDYESATKHTIRVKTTDAKGLSYEQDLIITVTDTEEKAATAIAPSNAEIEENSANGVVVGNLTSTDPNAGDVHTYELLDNAEGRFALVNNQIVVANGSLLHYEDATSHTIKVRTTDQTGLSYEQELTIQVKDVISAGLIAQYFGDQDLNNLLLTRKESTVNFDWGLVSPAASIPNDHFSARWSGQITVPSTGEYTFYAAADDGIRLWVNGQNLVDAWRIQGLTEYNGSISLEAGQSYDIRVEYYEYLFPAAAKLSWSGPGFTKQIVPVDVLSSRVDLTLGTEASNTPEILNPNLLTAQTPSDVNSQAIEPLAVTAESSKWDLINNFSQQMAQIIGDGSKQVEVLLLTTPLDQLLSKMSELQGVLISSTAQDLQKLAKGEKTLEDVVAANNSDGIAQKIEALNDLSTFGVVGTESNDELTSVAEKPLVVGKGGNDTLNGLSAADQMFGEGGNDTLIGNGGIDFLNGGDGDDTYALAANSGGTTIADNSGNDTVSGLTPVLEFMATGKMGLGRSGASLFIDLNQNGEIDILKDITILNYFADAPTEGAGVGFIETVGGLAGNDILGLLKNHAPTIQQTLAPQQLTPYESFNVTLSRNLFGESDPNDYVVYNVTQADGSALPDWVSFDASNMTLSGQATAEDIGQYQFKVVGTDQGKLSVETPLSVTVQNPVYGGTPNKDTLTGSDGDDVIDGGLEADTLIGKKGNDSYSVDHVNDKVTEQPNEGVDTVSSVIDYRLPDNVENLVLTGTGALKGIGNAANNLITGGTGNNFLQGGLGQDTVEGGAGADKFYFASPDDGQDLILDFDPTEGDRIQISTGGFGSNKLDDFSFSNGVLTFKGKAIATLQNDGQAYASFADLSQILDLPANTSPVVKQALPSLTVDEDAPQQTISLDNLFEDADGNALIKTVSANSNEPLVTATIVNQQLVLTFQPNQFGTAQITLQGSDNLDSVTSSFTLIVNAVNDIPTLNQALSNLSGEEGKAFRFVIPSNTFVDVEDSQLTYALTTESELPEGMVFDPVTGTFSGTPSGTAMGSYQITMIAKDKESAQVSTSFTLNIANTIAQDVTNTTTQFIQGKSGENLGNLTYDLQKYRADVTTKANDEALKQTDALFHNLVGLYEVQNNQGAILDSLDSNGNGLTTDLLNPNDAGYAKTAIANAVHNFVLQMGANGDKTKNTTAAQFGDVLLQGGKLFAPFVIANGGKLLPVGGTTQDGFNAFLAKNPTNVGATSANFLSHEVAYFSFGSANPDGVEHLQNRGNNVFGFEDLPGNLGISDMDFNDAVFKFTFTA